MIRALHPIPTDRFTTSPHFAFLDGGLAADDVDEFLDSLDRWRTAPPLVRFFAEFVAIRALIHNRHLEFAEPRLSHIATLATGLQSVSAALFVDELHGTLAYARQDWPEAVRWYGGLVEVADGQLRNWFDLSAAWRLLTARCLSPGDVEIRGDDLRHPWRCYHDEHLEVLRWRGAVATALALRRLGHTNLADRFVAWAYRDDPAGTMATTDFGGLLEISGLPTAEVDADDDPDTLIDELFEIADQLDLFIT